MPYDSNETRCRKYGNKARYSKYCTQNAHKQILISHKLMKKLRRDNRPKMYIYIYSCSEIITFNRIETVEIKRCIYICESLSCWYSRSRYFLLSLLSVWLYVSSYIHSGADRETAKVKVMLILLTKSYFKCSKSLKVSETLKPWKLL